MAAANQLQGLKEEASCSICRGYFTDPVSVTCGHTFCRTCITGCWEGLRTNFPCPQCKKRSRSKHLRSNNQLAKMVEMVKQLQTPNVTPQDENLCREHEEKLKLFCDDDQRAICVVCRESKEHKQHSARPILEAAQEHKESLHNHLAQLKTGLQSLQTWADEEGKTKSELKSDFKSQAEKICTIFELLKWFLEREKLQLVSNLKTEHEETMKRIERKLSELEEQKSNHRKLIMEVEGKCQQQDVELLKDVQITFSRCDKMKAAKPQEDAAVKQALQSVGQHALLKDKLQKLKVTIARELEWRYMKTYATEVALDPDTANHWLILSEDGKSMSLGDRAQDLPDNPQKFNKYPFVLGRERLSSGSHYWVVQVGGKTGWILGVCDESVNRKGKFTLSPEDGFWTVSLRDGEYRALTSPPTLLVPRVLPKVVGLFLDYEAGRLSLYNVDYRSLLFTFYQASFPPTLQPFFSPYLDARGRNP